MKKLIILDLDHTLIYGSYAEQESAILLFQYDTFLKVYKRPLVEILISHCKEKGDIIVFTTALRTYAYRICKLLNIQPIELLSRKQCTMKNGIWNKKIKIEWMEQYEQILIVDDSPNDWKTESSKIHFIIPSEFRGDIKDNGLENMINELSRY